MENPATWNEVEQTIAEAVTEHEQALSHQMIGSSLEHRIYRKLSEKGYLKPEFTK